MLPRAALRAARANVPLTPSTRLSAPAIKPFQQSFRAYASDPPRRPSRTPGQGKKPAPSQTPSAASGPARQTSPGTSFPKDQTWKPQDGIKMGGPAAATATGAGHQAAGSKDAEMKSEATPVDGSRPSEPAVQRPESPLEQDVTPQEPLAQQIDADAPAPGTIRDQAHAKQAASENTPPPETPADSEASQSPQKPLPDLRFGIPSTLDFEMGQKKGDEQGSAGQGEQRESYGLESVPQEAREQRGREEREYDRSAYETSQDRRRVQLMNYLYISMLAGIVAGSLYLTRPFSSTEEIPAGMSSEEASSWGPGSMYARVRARLGSQVGYYTEPSFTKLLPEVPEGQRPPFTLVLSLEDLMIHSDWDRKQGYRTAKRPGIDYFIRYLSQYYELVLFTSVPIAIADPVMRKLDPYHFIMWPLGREATKYEGGEYVKDLTYLNRPLSKTLVIDTHAPHVMNQPENAIVLPKWSGDPKDPHTKDLVALIPFLEYLATMGIDDVRPVLKSFEGKDIPQEFARREAEARAKFNAQLAQQKRGRPSFGVGSLASGLGIKGNSAAAGGMVLADGQSVAEGLAQGKMLSDQIREQGQKQYEYLEKQIRENGAQWLKEEEEEQKKMMEASMKDMKKSSMSWFGWFGGGEK